MAVFDVRTSRLVAVRAHTYLRRVLWAQIINVDALRALLLVASYRAQSACVRTSRLVAVCAHPYLRAPIINVDALRTLLLAACYRAQSACGRIARVLVLVGQLQF